MDGEQWRKKMQAMFRRAETGKNLKAIRKEFRLEAVRLELRAQTHGIPKGAVPEDMIREPRAVIGNIAQCLAKVEEMLAACGSMTEEDDFVFNQIIDDIMMLAYVLRHSMGHARSNAKNPKIDVVEHGSHRIHVVDSGK